MPFNRIEHAGAAVVSSLASDITSGATSISLTDSTGWPTGSTGSFYFVIDPGLVGEEKILATARSSNTLTGCTRGVDGTAQSVHTASAVVEHVFVATEADEANQAAHQTLGAVTTKGDMLAATGTNALARLAAGTTGQVLVADSAQTVGAKFGTVTSTGLAIGAVTSGAVAAGAVTNAGLANSAVTEAKLASTFWHRRAFTVADSGTSIDLVIPHGASFTPTMCLFMFTGPPGTFTSSTAFLYYVVIAIDATNVTVRCPIQNHSTVTGQILSIA